MVQVLAPRAGVAGMIATLFRLGVVLIDVVSGAGAITKYTVGPAWTGAEFATIQAAVNQAVADGHSGPVLGQTVEFVVYPGVYPDPVVIPETLPRFNFVGQGRNIGTRITGPVTLNLPSANGSFSFSEIAFIGQLTILQPVATDTITGYFFECSAQLAPAVNATRLSVEVNECFWLVGGTWNVREYISHGGRIGTSVSITSVVQNALYNTRLTGLVSTATWIFTAPFNAVFGSPQIAGRVTYNGDRCSQCGCWHTYNGSPAVTDNCAVSSGVQGNTFAHNAGPAGPVWIQTNPAAIFHDGGNTFAEGQQYPWFSIAGTRTDRSETDNELRRVLVLAGSNALTPAQVGAQRKTTVAATTGGSTQTLPDAALVEPGCTVVLKDSTGVAGATPIGLAAFAGQTIDGAASVNLTTDYESIEVQQSGPTSWMRIGRYP